MGDGVMEGGRRREHVLPADLNPWKRRRWGSDHERIDSKRLPSFISPPYDLCTKMVKRHPVLTHGKFDAMQKRESAEPVCRKQLEKGMQQRQPRKRLISEEDMECVP